MINYETIALEIATIIVGFVGAGFALGRLTAPGACVCPFCRGEKQDRTKTYPERYTSSTFREVGAE